MKVLLTGSEGYIGKPLYCSLLESGVDVQCFDVFGSREEWLAYFNESVVGNDYDVVIHAGAMVHPQSVDPDIFFWNYEATVKLVDALDKSRFVYFSSNMAVDPVNFYGWSKLASERYIQSRLEDYCILRLLVVFGSGKRLTAPSVADLLVEGKLGYIVDPYVRDYVYRDDVVAIAHNVALHDKCVGDYDIGTGVGYSTFDLVNTWDDGSDFDVVAPKVGMVDSIVARPDYAYPNWEYVDVLDWIGDKRDVREGRKIG